MPEQDHKARIQVEFSKQAEAFAAQPWIVDGDRIARLLSVVQPLKTDRVLDVATGPGYIAMGFAGVCREVVGLDLTETILQVAQRTATERGIHNLTFRVGDAEAMPFDDGEFNLSVSRFVVHHSESPQTLINEMARVVAPGGRVVIQDLTGSEHPARAAYHDRFERLRDPSHTSVQPLSNLIRQVAAAGLEVETVSSEIIEFDVDRWLQTTQTPPAAAAQVRELIDNDRQNDLSGTRPILRNGTLVLRERIAIVIGRKAENGKYR